MVEQHRNYCSACGHIMAKPKRGLFSIKFRRTVQKCANIDDLHEIMLLAKTNFQKI